MERQAGDSASCRILFGGAAEAALPVAAPEIGDEGFRTGPGLGRAGRWREVHSRSRATLTGTPGLAQNAAGHSGQGQNGGMNHPEWLEWAQRLQAIAQTGLTYCRDPFDKERYEAVREIAAEIMARGAGMSESSVVLDLFRGDTGYATPKVDVRAAVFDHGRLLLVREREDGGWTLPGGWADIGSSASENVVREVREESGYEAEVVKLAAVYDRNRHGHPPIPWYTYKLFFVCRLTGGAAAASQETDGADFFEENDLPPLSLTRVTAEQIGHMFEHWRHPEWATSVD
jgi:ADP-ribose pyrophosphatase YjhB (NUDIX family)